MKILPSISIMLLSALTLNAACKENRQQNISNTPTEMTDNQTTAVTAEENEVTVTCIRDNKKERIMPLSLFGNIPQSLIDSLGISNGIPASVNAILVKTGDTTILFDTGFGNPDSQLHTALNNKPEDVKYIYLTHFHGDHIGGMMKGDKPAFPNAEVYASREEYEGWMKMPEKDKAQVVKTMKAYEKHLHLFEFGDTLPGNVIALDGRGHTPGHTIYNVNNEVLIAGDIMHGMALQLPHPEYCASYDMDKENAIKTRKRFIKYAKEKKIDIAGMHIPLPGIISFK